MAHDRFGEEIDDDTPPPHNPHCDGWIGGHNAEPPLKPCLVCKPHLDPVLRRRALMDADELRATRSSEGDTQ